MNRGIALVLAVGFGSIVYGSTALADDVIYYACVKSNGKMSSMSVGVEPTCKHNETLIQWNETGPQGPPGGDGSSALWANVESDGLLLQHSGGISSSLLRTGVYRVTFPQPVASCAMSISASQYLGTGIIGINPGAIDPPDLSHFFFSVYGDLSTANSIVVGERTAAGALADGPFSIVMICP